ncbi:uncharacterized protein PST29_5766 [Pseudomonas sp. St29]|nr:uncharacterized protein PST29_5766 [Pseudomonas sp. St29]
MRGKWLITMCPTIQLNKAGNMKGQNPLMNASKKPILISEPWVAIETIKLITAYTVASNMNIHFPKTCMNNQDCELKGN